MQAHRSHKPASHALGYSLATIVVASLALTSCRTMTTARELQLKAEKQKAIEAEKVATENKDDLKKLEKAKRENKIKRKQIELRQERERTRIAAYNDIVAGKTSEAIETIQKVFAESELAKKREDEEEEITDLKEVLAPSLQTAEKQRWLGLLAQAHYRAESVDKAIEVFEELVELNPRDTDSWDSIGRLYFNKKNYEKSVAAFKKVLAGGSRSGDTLYFYAIALFEVSKKEGSSGKKEAVLIALREALLEKPDDLDLIRWIASLEFDIGRHEEALRLFDRILLQKPLDPEYLELKANSQLQLNRLSEALATLELAYSVGNRSQDVLRMLGDLCGAQGLLERGAQYLSKAYGDDPSRAPSRDRYRIGQMFSDAERVDEATTWLEAIGEEDKDYADAQGLMAYVYGTRGLDDEALEAYNNVRRVRPSTGPAHIAAAEIYFNQGDLDKADAAYAKAVDLDTASKASGLAGRAEVQYKRGDLKRAVDLYNRAIRVAPERKNLHIALREIQRELEFAKASKEFEASRTTE